MSGGSQAAPAGTKLPAEALPETGALAPAVRRSIVWLIIAVAAAQGLANILTASVMYSPARWPDNRPPYTPVFSANDRSRWATVWSLAERGTYQIDEIIRRPGWDTIDKVRYQEHFYSSKPPLLSTIVAGLYWTLKRATGIDLVANTHEMVELILLIVNWVPWIIALWLLSRMGERYGRTDWSRLFLVMAAASGTFLTTFLITFNNHSVAASSVVFALAPALSILIDDRREWWRFALAGFWAAFVVCNELPAAAFGAALFVLLVLRAPAPTLKFFVPAALVPLGAFFYTNWLATGGLMPFYASFGSGENDYYRYVVDGIPSYWMNPSAIDVGEKSSLVYLLHSTIGHHGIFSLSPVFLLTIASWLRWSPNSARLKTVTWLSLGLTVWVIAFYLAQTKSYNYGGSTSGLRWAFWLIPFWLLAMIPVLDDWENRRLVRALSVLFLAVSVFSATMPHQNPWTQPWLQTLLARWKIGVPEAVPTAKLKSQPLWFSLPDEDVANADEYWIELEGTGAEGGTRRIRLELEGNDAGVCTIVATVTDPGASEPTRYVISLDRKKLAGGKGIAASLVDASGGDRQAVIRFLAGLPRPVKYGADKIRYLHTPLRRDAFACMAGGASVGFKPQAKGRELRYRRLIWWNDEVPFGVVQIEDTTNDPRDNAVLFRQRLTVTRSGKLLPKADDADTQSSAP